MIFSAANNQLFNQLDYLLEVLTPEQYTLPVASLGGVSLGQHTRHVIEFYECLVHGVRAGVVCYDERSRDPRIETDPAYARQLLQTVERELRAVEADRDMRLKCILGKNATVAREVTTTYERECIYLAEHTVHHLALIRVGLRLEFPVIELPDELGVAASTMRFRQQTLEINGAAEK